MDLLQLDQAQAQLVLGHHLGIFIAGRQDPGHLLPDVDPVQQHRTEIKDIGFDPGRTGHQGQGIDPFVGHIRLDQFHPFGPAKPGMGLAYRGLEFLGGHLLQSIYIQGIYRSRIQYKYIRPVFYPCASTSSPQIE